MNLVDVRDVATGLFLAMERGQTGQRYILGGENITLKKLLAIIGVISGRSALRIPIPVVMAQTPLQCWNSSLITSPMNRRPRPSRACDSRPARKPCRSKRRGANSATRRVRSQRLWKKRYNRFRTIRKQSAILFHKPRYGLAD